MCEKSHIHGSIAPPGRRLSPKPSPTLPPLYFLPSDPPLPPSLLLQARINSLFGTAIISSAVTAGWRSNEQHALAHTGY